MMVDQDYLTRMLTQLKLTAIRDQLDGLLDEAGRGELSIRESLTMLCEREIARKDQRRLCLPPPIRLRVYTFRRDGRG